MAEQKLAKLNRLIETQDLAFKRVRRWTAQLMSEGGEQNQQTCEELAFLVQLISDQNDVLCLLAEDLKRGAAVNPATQRQAA